MINNESISYSDTPGSYSTFAMPFNSCSTLATLLIGLTITVSNLEHTSLKDIVAREYISAKAQSDSYDSFSNPLSGELKTIEYDFEHEISNLFSKLLASQQPLGEKFEQVLFKNLWDLYED